MKKVILSFLMLSTQLHSAETPAFNLSTINAVIFHEIKSKADSGDTDACLSYGSYLVASVPDEVGDTEQGRRTIMEGLSYLTRAAEAGQGDACLMLGISYAEGHYGVNADKEKSISYFQKAVDKGVTKAYVRLAQQLVSDDFTCDQANIVVDLLEKSIAAGDLAGYYYYAILLREANFIESDLFRAFSYFKKASDEGDYSYADGMVAIMYHGGEGVAQSYLEAEKYYEKALAKEPDHAQYQLNLAQILFNGQGKVPNLGRAEQLLTAAADSGSAEAQRVLGVRLYKGQRLTVNQDRGLEYLKKAAAQGDVMAGTMIFLFGMGM